MASDALAIELSRRRLIADADSWARWRREVRQELRDGKREGLGVGMTERQAMRPRPLRKE